MSEPYWVPLGGQPVDYEGAWAAGTAYLPGDVVRYNGIDYLAVNPSTGQTPPVATTQLPGYGTSLPASPFDGQEYILVDSVTNPGYVWRFRYNAGSSSTYKWEFVGGAPVVSGPTGSSGTTASTSWSDLPSGPVAAAPRAGEYSVSWSMMAQNWAAVSVAYNLNMALAIAGARGQILAVVCPDNTKSAGGVVAANERRTAAQGAVFTLQYSCGIATNSAFSLGSMSLLPIRVA